MIAADTAPDRVEFARDVLGYSRGTTDYREVLADPEVDVVSICAPNFLHAEIGVAAAGSPVVRALTGGVSVVESGFAIGAGSVAVAAGFGASLMGEGVSVAAGGVGVSAGGLASGGSGVLDFVFPYK